MWPFLNPNDHDNGNTDMNRPSSTQRTAPTEAAHLC